MALEVNKWRGWARESVGLHVAGFERLRVAGSSILWLVGGSWWAMGFCGGPLDACLAFWLLESSWFEWRVEINGHVMQMGVVLVGEFPLVHVTSAGS